MTIGPLRQIGYISRDIDRTLKHFIDMWGIGPWYRVDHYPLKRASYRGKEIELDLSVALANSGPMQFEIIQQNNAGPSIYTDFLNGVSGLHAQHLALWPTDYDACRAKAVARGFVEVQEGLSNTGPFSYYLHPAEPGQMLEISTLTPDKDRIFGAIAKAAVGWDGRDPVRYGLPG